MARPLVAQINLAALAAEPERWQGRRRPGAQVLAVVKANAYGHGLHARAAGARRRPTASRWSSWTPRSRCARRTYSRRILLHRGLLRGARAARDRAARASPSSSTTTAQVAMLERAVLPRPLEVFVKVNTGMNRLGLPPAEVARVCERLARAPARRRAAADDALRARRRGRRPAATSSRRSRTACRNLPVSALARQLGRRRPLRRRRRRHRAPGHHALRRDARSRTRRAASRSA